jgi:hypothetical protein
MSQRGITGQEIYAALARRFKTIPAGASGNIWVFGYVPGARILKVLVDPDETTIITAAWPDK